jgi:hypothetical protein
MGKGSKNLGPLASFKTGVLVVAASSVAMSAGGCGLAKGVGTGVKAVVNGVVDGIDQDCTAMSTSYVNSCKEQAKLDQPAVEKAQQDAHVKTLQQRVEYEEKLRALENAHPGITGKKQKACPENEDGPQSMRITPTGNPAVIAKLLGARVRVAA